MKTIKYQVKGNQCTSYSRSLYPRALKMFKKDLKSECKKVVLTNRDIKTIKELPNELYQGIKASLFEITFEYYEQEKGYFN